MRGVYLALLVPAVLAAQNTGAGSATNSLLDIKRIYVAPLTGGKESAALRDLIIAGLDSTKLFVLTENPDRADAILKGAADDNTFTDTFDSGESVNAHQTLGKYGSGASAATRTGGGYGAVAMGENDIHHIKERKHEAYAAVRLCNKDGDVLWSTTQESLGAKFRGASADVAAKIAHQLTIDYDRARRPTPASDAAAPGPRP
jgi:hypothetical protein